MQPFLIVAVSLAFSLTLLLIGSPASAAACLGLGLIWSARTMLVRSRDPHAGHLSMGQVTSKMLRLLRFLSLRPIIPAPRDQPS